MSQEQVQSNEEQEEVLAFDEEDYNASEKADAETLQESASVSVASPEIPSAAPKKEVVAAEVKDQTIDDTIKQPEPKKEVVRAKSPHQPGPNVRVYVKEKCEIFVGKWYKFRSGEVAIVPPNVKEALKRSNKLGVE